MKLIYNTLFECEIFVADSMEIWKYMSIKNDAAIYKQVSMAMTTHYGLYIVM